MEKYFQTKENIKMLVAFSAEEGIELARKLKPDLILLDIHLPNMNGFEACER